MIPEHMGKLHPYEHVLVLLLAFGPFLLLAVTIRIARKRNRDGSGPFETGAERPPQGPSDAERRPQGPSDAERRPQGPSDGAGPAQPAD